MGTTLVALLHAPILNGKSAKRRTAADHTNSRVTDPPTLWLGHVGDSRCYRRRRGKLEQLTHDHSLVEEQVRAGQITAEQAAQSPMRNLITRAIGSQPSVEAEIQSHRPQPNDVYLLASDGLTHEIDDEEISKILAAIPKPPTSKCNGPVVPSKTTVTKSTPSTSKASFKTRPASDKSSTSEPGSHNLRAWR